MTDQELIDEGKRIITDEVHALHASSERLGMSFAEAVKILEQASTVLVIGLGKSGYVARKIAATLSSVGTPSHFLHPVEALHGDLGVASSSTVAVVISKSGTTAEIITLLPFLKSRGMRVIGLVGSLNSYLATHCDVVLDASTDREACSFNIVPSSSTTVALALGDALALTLMKVRHVQPADFAHNHPLGQLGKNLNLSVADVMHHGEQIPHVAVGSGFRDALIEMSSKGLGCVCVLSEEGRLQGIITDGDVRRSLQAHDDIRNLRVQDVMTSHPVSTIPDVLLQEALAIMESREKQLGVLPVVDGDNRCVGVIRLHDIVRSGIN